MRKVNRGRIPLCLLRGCPATLHRSIRSAWPILASRGSRFEAARLRAFPARAQSGERAGPTRRLRAAPERVDEYSVSPCAAPWLDRQGSCSAFRHAPPARADGGATRDLMSAYRGVASLFYYLLVLAPMHFAERAASSSCLAAAPSPLRLAPPFGLSASRSSQELGSTTLLPIYEEKSLSANGRSLCALRASPILE